MNYKKVIFIMILVLFDLSMFNVFHINNTLKKYEYYDNNNYMKNILKNIKKLANNNELDKVYHDKVIDNDYEKQVSLLDAYKEQITNNELNYKTTDNGEVQIYAGDKPLNKISFNIKDKKALLGLLNYKEYTINNIYNENTDGFYNLDISALSNFKVYINNTLIKEKDIVSSEKITYYSEVYKYIDIPMINKYHIDGLMMKPTIVIKDMNDNNISYQIINNQIIAETPMIINDYESAKKHLKNDFNPLELAELWSLYLSNDLNGKNGIYTLMPYLVKNTKIYTRAYNWSRTYDIYFTSPHTLKNPAFINEKMNNFRFYDKNNFSVDIHFDKQMILNNNQEKIDQTNERFFFSYINGSYKLINTKSIEGIS